MSFLHQIEQSRKEVQRLAKSVPHIFPEWQELQAAKAALEKAAARYEAAKAAWVARGGAA